MATANEVKNIIKGMVWLYNQFSKEIAISEAIGSNSDFVKNAINNTKELRDDALDTIKKHIKDYNMTFEDVAVWDNYVDIIWINGFIKTYKYNRIKMI